MSNIMLLFNQPAEIPKPTLLTYLEPPKIEEQIPEEEQEVRELTLQEKIDQNFYNCNEDIEYIRADNAQCLPKARRATSSTQSVSNTTSTQKPVRRASTAPRGWYPSGQCTWYVSTRRPVGNWGNASSWKSQALAEGYTHSTTPVPGAIAWRYGHVAYVESVSGNNVTISEANYDYRGSIRTITVPVSSYSYLY